MTETHTPSEYPEPLQGDTEPLMRDIEEARQVTQEIPDAYHQTIDSSLNNVEQMQIGALPVVEVVTGKDSIAKVTQVNTEIARTNKGGRSRSYTAEVVDTEYSDGDSDQRGSVKIRGERADGTKFEMTKEKSPKLAAAVAGFATRALIERAKKQ
jgi:hypothetical protein